MMLNWYYKIWVDAIAATRAKKTEAANWKLYTIVPISALMGINLLTLFVLLKSLVNRNLPLYLPVTIFDYRLINDFISIIVTLFIPFVILNYLLIFNQNRYALLAEEYKAENGKFYKRYALISLGLLIIPLIVFNFYFKPV